MGWVGTVHRSTSFGRIALILVDSSAWISLLRGSNTRPVLLLHGLHYEAEDVVTPDIVVMEVLMGARDDAHAARIEGELRRFGIVVVGGEAVAREAARNYRLLRAAGVTIRSGVDMLIGTYCLLHDAALLHGDRDFAAMERHLGLRCL